MTAVSGHPAVEDCLFHYTSAVGLTGILKQQCIRATDSAFLNDSLEISFGAIAVQRHLDNWIREIELTPPTSGSDEWHRLQHLYAVVDILEKFNDVEECAPTTVPTQLLDGATYVACFTEQPDQLSQWRGYGGQGYSIGFTRDGLDGKLIVDGLPSTLSPSSITRVMYGSSGIEAVCQSLRDFFRHRPIPVIPTAVQITDVVAQIIPRLAEVKHPAFSEEREWRVTVPSYGHGPAQNLNFREGTPLVPYLNLRFDPSAVAYVYIGPGGTYHDKRALRAFLLAHGYDLDRIRLEHSEAPYRGA